MLVFLEEESTVVVLMPGKKGNGDIVVLGEGSGNQDKSSSSDSKESFHEGSGS